MKWLINSTTVKIATVFGWAGLRSDLHYDKVWTNSIEFRDG